MSPEKPNLIGLDDHMTVEIKMVFSCGQGEKLYFLPSGATLFFPQELSVIEGKPPEYEKASEC